MNESRIAKAEQAVRERLEAEWHAAKQLGWMDVKTTTVKNLDDALQRLKAERDENTCRLDFAPSEGVMMARTIRPFEEKAARERQRTLNNVAPGKFPEAKGNSGDKTAASLGLSRHTLERATEIVEAAK